MDPNMTVHYMAVEADRKTLDARAGRGWQAEQVCLAPRAPASILAARQRWSSLTARARWSAGRVLVHTGARLGGAPGIEAGLHAPEA
ncbi:MAG TPA: hypothetical protein VGR16_01745 [Thermomicrobiales bacterium]|nr:hypothetical protein [Thermomicrobiales bacterium]